MIMGALVKQQKEERGRDYWLAHEGNLIEVHFDSFRGRNNDYANFTEKVSGLDRLLSGRQIQDCVFDDEVDALLAARDHCEFKRKLYQARLDEILMDTGAA